MTPPGDGVELSAGLEEAGLSARPEWAGRPPDVSSAWATPGQALAPYQLPT